MSERRVILYPRKQLDIRWTDLAAGLLRCLLPGDPAQSEKDVCQLFAPGRPVLVTYAVRAGFDLFLKAPGRGNGDAVFPVDGMAELTHEIGCGTVLKVGGHGGFVLGK